GGAAALAEGVLQAMWISKLKGAVAVMLALAVVGTGASVLVFGGHPAEPEASKKADPAPKTDEKAELLRKKAIARLDLAKAAYQGYLLRFENGMETEQTVNLWSRRWLQAQLDLSDKKADRDAVLQAHLDRLKKVDEIARARLDLGGSPQPVQSVEEELKNYETVLQQFMGRTVATPEQVCHASARLLMAQQVYRKGFNFKMANVELVIARLTAQLG